MPIETPAGTLTVENAILEASSFKATTAVGIGTDNNDAYPLQIFKETGPVIRIQEGTTQSSAARLYSNNSNLYIQTGTDFSSGSSGDIAFQNMQGQSTHMVIKSDGKVGVGTGSPQETFHLYGSPMIQHETRYSVGANDGWYKIGTWDAGSTTGARLKISLLGAEGYSAQNVARGGETILYASINNNDPTTVSNMSGSIHAHGDPVITQAKFQQVGADRSKYDIIAYVKTYTQHSMKIECSETSTFTRAWTSASDPGADSATVQAALFTHVVDNSGNVGIGTTNPSEKLHVNGIIRNQNPSWCLYKLGTTSYSSGYLRWNYVRASAINCTMTASGGYYDRVTITVPGRYFIGFDSFSDPNQSGVGWQYDIRKNGLEQVRSYFNPPNNNYCAMGGLRVVLDLVVNDYIQIRSDNNVHHSSNCPFYGFLIG
jgi:hypothetical protein